ncbi:MAG: hypothetical protein PF436_12835 [Prolixibacteraceae bacterium]|jgi:chromosome segregation ATPase|nr:hypothetical protein [Prolixibacteraceae bacterium]
MSNSVISNKIILSIILLAGMSMTSCVAKKKYIAMQESRNRAEQRVRVLTQDVQNLESEFNSYKNDFHANNETKDSMIDSLSLKINQTNAALLSRDENIDEKVFSFQVEKRRLNEMLANKDREIRILNNEKQSLENQIKELEKQTRDTGLKIRESSIQQNAIQAELEQKEKELTQLQSQISQKNQEISSLQSAISKKDEEIEKLSNQVKLLKTQFGQ